MTFSNALEQIKEGKKVSRDGWNGKGMYLFLASCDLPYPPLPSGEAWKEGVFQSVPFIVMKTADSKLVPWLASQTDILADDWGVVE